MMAGMEAIFEDLIRGQAYTLETTCQSEAEDLVWPIVQAMFDRNICVCIHDDEFLKRYLLPPTIEVRLRREFYHKLGDYETLRRLEKEDIEQKWPKLNGGGGLQIMSETQDIQPMSIQVFYKPMELPRWTFVGIEILPPPKRCTKVMVVIPVEMTHALRRIEKCAPFANVMPLLKTGDVKAVEDAGQVLCVSTTIEKEAIIQQSMRSNLMRTKFDVKYYPRWNWCINFLYGLKAHQRVILLTANSLPAGLCSIDHVVNIPGIFHRCIHVDSLELGPTIDADVQNALDTFNQCGKILIITNAHDTCDSAAGNIPMWFRLTSYTDLVLLDAAWQKWPLPNSVIDKVDVWKVVLSPFTCQESGLLWVAPHERSLVERETTKFDNLELQCV